MAVAVPKQPTLITEQHRKNSCSTVASTQHKGGNNKEVISDYKEIRAYPEDTGAS